MNQFMAFAALALTTVAPIAIAQTLFPTGDTFVAAGNVNNFGTSPLINVGGVAGYQGLIQFNLADLPSNATSAGVSKAAIVLFVNKVGSAGAVSIHAATGTWTESLVNGTTRLQRVSWWLLPFQFPAEVSISPWMQPPWSKPGWMELFKTKVCC